MSQKSLPFRQVHLDFHTSEHIPDVGARFDPEIFAATLEKAAVQSVVCFARCHHGHIYYDSRLNPERIHPNLKRRDLLHEQIEACHARGLHVPIYTTVQWDHFTASRHPEWLAVAEDGAPAKMFESGPHEAGFYRYLCLNSPYRDWLKAHTREILETLPTDGLWFDIVWSRFDCSCRYCKNSMRERGMDFHDKTARLAWSRLLIEDFTADMTAFVRQFNADCSIYYNSADVKPGNTNAISAFTHLEFDALPSEGPDGYLNFPRQARFERNLGKDCLGMTGKFHRGWGDIHSFKNPAALQFDCFQLLSLACKCVIGDQLDPSGQIDPHTYDLIGPVFQSVREKEPWCENARPVTEIGLLWPWEWNIKTRADVGATRILQEGGHQFDLLDSGSDFGRYKLLILPDRLPCNADLAEKIEIFVQNGGKLLASFEAGLNDAKIEFLPSLGVRLRENPTLDSAGNLVRGELLGCKQADYADFILPQGEIGKGLPATEHAMYARAAEVEIQAGAEILAPVVTPYFFRTAEHFSSHMHAASSGKADSPAVVQNGNAIYFAHPIFELYDQFAMLWCKKLVLNAIEILLPEPLLRHDGPGTLVTTINEQENRWIVHLMHYIPERRGQRLSVLEDVIPLFDLKLSIRAPRPIRTVSSVPDGENLEFSASGERTEFSLPRLDGHQMICLEF